MIPRRNWIKYKIHPRIEKVLYDEVDQHKEEWDTIFLVTGDEGTGKTTLAQLFGNWCHPLHIQDFAWNYSQIMKRLNVYKQRNIIVDEAILLNARDWNTKEVKAITRKLNKCREQGLYVWLLIPNIFDLDKRILRRARGLFYTYTLKKGDKKRARGYGTYLNRDQIYQLRRQLKDTVIADMGKVPRRFGFDFTFSNTWVVDKSEYSNLKLKHTQEETELITKKEKVGRPKKKNLQRCPDKSCGSSNFQYYIKNNKYLCKKCGNVFEKPEKY